MEVTLHIPDQIADSLTMAGVDLPRRALESFALEELRAGRISEPDLCQILDMGRLELDGFLKSHGVFEEYSMEDFEDERRALRELGL